LPAWGKAVRFCRANCPTVAVVWLVTVAAGLVVSPLGLLAQLGVVTDLWALTGLALLYAACIGSLGVLLAGLTMSLYLARREPPGRPEARLADVA
jgi:hypothetical protein